MEMKLCVLIFISWAGLCFLCQAHAVSSNRSIRQRRSSCGANLFGETGIIESPNYPNHYPSHADCLWVITVPKHSQIVLTFHVYDIEIENDCDFDYLEVRDGPHPDSNLLRKLCGNGTSSPIESSTNKMRLRFVSDGSIEERGFIAEFRKVPDCGGELTSEEGDVTSPLYPNKYGKNHDCVWVITVPKNYQVMLRFRSFQLESSPSCTADFVEIHDGPRLLSPLMGVFCGAVLPREMRSSWNSISIRFKTDVSSEYRGFSVHFMKVQPVQPPAQKPRSMGIRNLPASLTNGIALFLLKYVLM